VDAITHWWCRIVLRFAGCGPTAQGLRKAKHFTDGGTRVVLPAGSNARATIPLTTS
jgi:hypothetical protein